MLHSLIGSMYFSTQKDAEGKLGSKYEGTVMGFLIRKDDGTEYVLRDEKKAAPSATRLNIKDTKTLKVGDKLEYKKNEVKVLRTYPDYGDVWIQNDATNENKVVKYWELGRCV